MPYTITKKGGKYILKLKDGGRLLGTHTSRKKALKQIAVIEIIKHKKIRQTKIFMIIISLKFNML